MLGILLVMIMSVILVVLFLNAGNSGGYDYFSDISSCVVFTLVKVRVVILISTCSQPLNRKPYD